MSSLMMRSTAVAALLMRRADAFVSVKPSVFCSVHKIVEAGFDLGRACAAQRLDILPHRSRRPLPRSRPGCCDRDGVCRLECVDQLWLGLRGEIARRDAHALSASLKSLAGVGERGRAA